MQMGLKNRNAQYQRKVEIESGYGCLPNWLCQMATGSNIDGMFFQCASHMCVCVCVSVTNGGS